MLRVNHDENADIATGLNPLKNARSEKKFHKNALGDVKNTIHNTPMGAVPKTPFQGQLKAFTKSPVNQMMNPTRSVKKSLIASGIPVKSVKKPRKKGVRYNPELIDYDDYLPESVYKDNEPSLMHFWAQMNCPAEQEMTSLIELTLNHRPEEIPPKCHPYEEDELMMPPPSPAESADFPFEAPPMVPLDIPDMDFAKLALHE